MMNLFVNKIIIKYNLMEYIFLIIIKQQYSIKLVHAIRIYN